jgi:hypothetical protein
MAGVRRQRELAGGLGWQMTLPAASGFRVVDGLSRDHCPRNRDSRYQEKNPSHPAIGGLNGIDWLVELRIGFNNDMLMVAGLSYKTIFLLISGLHYNHIGIHDWSPVKTNWRPDDKLSC